MRRWRLPLRRRLPPARCARAGRLKGARGACRFDGMRAVSPGGAGCGVAVWGHNAPGVVFCRPGTMDVKVQGPCGPRAQRFPKRPDAGVVTGRDVVAPMVARVVEQCVELEVAVAVDAGVGRTPLLVGPHELLDDPSLERRAQVDDLVRKAQAPRDRRRIVGIGAAAACAWLGVAVQQHRRAQAFVARLLEQVGGDAGVDAAAHGDEHAFAGHGAP